MILLIGDSIFKESMKMSVEVFHNFKSMIKKKYRQDATNIGDEGVLAPNIQAQKIGLEYMDAEILKKLNKNKKLVKKLVKNYQAFFVKEAPSTKLISNGGLEKL